MNDINDEDWVEAIRNDDSVKLQSLIKSHPVDINTSLRQCQGGSLLIYAVRLNRLCLVDILLRNNADVDQADDFGYTACHQAVWLGTDAVSALALLLSYRPNLSLMDRKGTTVLSFAFSRVAAHCLPLDVLFMLVAAGAPIDASIDNVFLCFFAATSTAAIQLLLKHGIVVGTLVDHSGATPLHHACDCSEFDLSTFDMLLKNCGVDLQKRDSSGFTCTYTAVRSRNDKALCWLIANGADLFNAFDSRFTLMHAVCDYDCAISLLAAGVSADGVNYIGGKTPIHYAAFLEKYDIIYPLLSVDDTQLDVPDFYGVTGRQQLMLQRFTIDMGKVETAGRDIAKKRLDFVRYRALQVCIGLQSLDMPVLQTCEILLFACGPVAPLVAFHQWWKIASTVKHKKF